MVRRLFEKNELGAWAKQARILAAMIVAASSASLAWSQQTGVADAPRRATRCSPIFDLSAKEAKSSKGRESSKAMANSMMRLATMLGASRESSDLWLQEMGKEMSTADAAWFQTQIADCRALMHEQDGLLQVIFNQSR